MRWLIAFLVLSIPIQGVSQTSEESYSTGLVFEDSTLYETIPKFAVPGLPKKRPESFVLSPIPKPGNQGRQGSCVGWAVAYGAKSISNALKVGDMTLEKGDLFSPSFLFNNVKVGGCSEGATLRGALEFMDLFGSVKLQDFPYTAASCDRIGDDDTFREAKENAIRNFARVSSDQPVSDNDLDDILNLISANFPVLVAMRTPGSFHKFRRAARGNVLNANDFDTDQGGHAVVLVGYDDEKQAALMLNSWGRAWGFRGLAWVHYDYLKQTVMETYVMLD